MSPQMSPSGRLPLSYDPKSPHMTPFAEKARSFSSGEDDPRRYLERGLEAVDAMEGEVKAFAHLDVEGARRRADVATERYKAGKPLSPIDGMTIGVKDVIDTADMPTCYGSPLFQGNRPQWDATCVHWLKQAGAVILGKTVTTEFATKPAGPTRNPFNLDHSPGGSSSGSAASVGSGMAAAGLGTQVRGSIVRPASYCGVYGFKPSYGVLSRDGIQPMSTTLNHLGVLAASLEDAWLTVHLLSRLGGGAPGVASLPGATRMPEPKKPARLIRIETAGWQITPDADRAALEALVDRLADDGVEIVSRHDNAAVDQFEALSQEVDWAAFALSAWENRTLLMQYAEKDASKLSPLAAKAAASAADLTPEPYADALAVAEVVRTAYAKLADLADGCITLSAPGIAPEGMDTGNYVFNDPFSMAYGPALNLPLLASDGMPLGVQLTGFVNDDYRLIAMAKWLTDFSLGS